MLFRSPSFAPGTVFNGRYQIVRCLRAGGMGAVYEVVQLETRRRRAMKVMLPELVTDEELRARFRLEATIASEIESDHIVETLDAGVDPGTGAPFLVMELLRGRDLGDVMRERRLTASEVALLLGQAAIALEKTHKAGIIHRDLKPENLFLTVRDDRTPRLKILDFGIAKVLQKQGSAVMTQAVGTPPYMAPEQIEGAPTLGPRTDLYALAHIAYALLVGQPYFGEDGALAVLARVLRGPVEKPSVRAARSGVVLPPAFDAWFAVAAAPEPKDRFNNAPMMIGMLAIALGLEAFRKMSGAAMSPETLALALDQTQADVSPGISRLVPVQGASAPEMIASMPLRTPTGGTAGSFAVVSPARAARRRAGVLFALGITGAVVASAAAVTFFALRRPMSAGLAADGERGPVALPSTQVVSPPPPRSAPATSATSAAAVPPDAASARVPEVVPGGEPSAAASASPPKGGRTGTTNGRSPSAPTRPGPVAPPALPPVDPPSGRDPTRTR